MNVSARNDRADALVEITTTRPDDVAADGIAKSLVEQRFVACAQVATGITSTYRWQGTLEQSSECRLVLKTLASMAHRVVDALRAQHPYSVPEITLKTLDWVNEPYMEWVRESIDPASVRTPDPS
ncbi:MAG: divalent-cation tolerance protein CutA [Pirellula sp.]